MIKYALLQNYRKHKHLEVNFTEGLNVIRSANEGGKSSLLEAVMYALYGAEVLRDTIAETVTWGVKVNDLKVKVVLGLQGMDYTFTRSPNGAECNYGGGKVVGQTEVSSFAAELIGANAKTGSNLMLANQGNLRGALEEGPKALSSHIETLANFDLFETLLDNASKELSTGSTKHLETRLSDLKNMTVADVPPPPPLNTQAHEDEIQQIQSWIPSYDLDITQAREDMQAKEDALRSHTNLSNQLAKDNDLLALKKQEKLDAEAKAKVCVPPAEIEAATKALAEAEHFAQVKEAHRQFQVCLTQTKDHLRFPITVPELLKTLEGQQGVLTNTLDAVRTTQTDIRLLEQQIEMTRKHISHDETCPTCGQTRTNLEDIRTANAVAEASILDDTRVLEAFRTKLTDQQTAIQTTKESLQDLESLVRTNNQLHDFAAKYSTYVKVDESQAVPGTLVWVGPVVNATTDAAQYRLECASALQVLQDRVAACAKAEARVVALTEVIAEQEEKIARTQGQLQAVMAVSPEQVAEAKRTWDNALVKRSNAVANLAELQAQLNAMVNEYNRAMQQHKDSIEARASHYKQISDMEQDIKDVEFNNRFIKKIREARPIVSDKLWAMVLSCVSVIFSQMREEQSVVSKDAKGFKVNGVTTSSLSGSTLDLLGLAIRTALVRTFLPHASFIILDEPGAAMDTERVENMLAFLMTSGFRQTLLVTHEDISEQFASNLISF